MKTNKPYSLNLTTPGGKCAAEADTMKGLVEITPRGLLGESAEKAGQSGDQRLDDIARALLAVFLNTSKGKLKITHTKISKARCEIDLMKCYLLDMTVDEALDWIQENKGVQTSKSAVGRYWKALKDIGPAFKARL